MDIFWGDLKVNQMVENIEIFRNSKHHGTNSRSRLPPVETNPSQRLVLQNTKRF